MPLPDRHRPQLFIVVMLAMATLPLGAARAEDQSPRDNGAQDRGGQERGPIHDRREEQRALSDAVRRVGRATGGEVLSAERVQSDGRDINRVKVVDSSGRVRVYMDDPQRNPRQDPARTRGNDNNND